jgi:hypothetical protein
MHGTAQVIGLVRLTLGFDFLLFPYKYILSISLLDVVFFW